MNRQTIRFFVLLLCFLLSYLASSCEGGKNKNSCLPEAGNQSSELCQIDKPSGDNCPDGQVRENGLCVPQKSRCPSGSHLENGTCVQDSIHVEVVDLEACNAENGVREILIEFIARDEDGYAIDPELNNLGQATALSTELLINGQPVNIESETNIESELLNSELVLSLVLDNSGSMIPSIPAMKEAAISILKQTQSKWEDSDSFFRWELLWFNEFLYKPALDLNDQPWAIDDIARLPNPEQGAGTDLFRAVHYMVGYHKDLLQQGVASGARDQHVMIVLSDGIDTHSWYSNKDHLVTDNVDNELFWTEFGTVGVPYTNLADRELPSVLAATLASKQANLKIHVIGLGESANTKGELEEIANQGDGLYFYGASSSALNKVFEDVSKEFITVQTIGVRTSSLQPGIYDLALKVKHINQQEGTTTEPLRIEVSDDLQDCP